MPWDRVIGQERALDALRRVLASDRVAHAYLFHGPDGTGKRAAALAFAQALQCERRGTPGGAPDEACGRCLPCTKVARLIHPDVHVYLPRPSDADAGDLAERVARLAEEPYAAVDYRRRPSLDDAKKGSNKQSAYSIALVNEEVRRALAFRPVEGRRVVAVLTDAEAMRDQAANAFLKLLEEPAAAAVLILTAERADGVLPTVLSRCQRVRFDPLPPEAVEVALAERIGVEAGRAAFVARLADGSYTRALALLESEDLAAQRALAVDFLRAAFTGQPARLAALVEQAAGLGREPLKGFLGLLLNWVRDLVLAREMGADAPLVNVDQAEAVRRFVAHLPDARLGAMAVLVEQAADLLERNVHTGLTLTVLAHALQDAMHGRPRDRLFAPLAESLST